MANGIGRRLALVAALAGGVALVSLTERGARGEDWPQFRGPDRAARVSDFKAPKTWPKELKQGWKVTVGEGVCPADILLRNWHGSWHHSRKRVAEYLRIA